MIRRLSLVLAALGACALVDARAQGVRLPDIGSSAGQMLTPTEERAYGANMLHELRGLALVLDDPLLDDYIATLGYRLVAHSDKPDRGKYTFFVVRDKAINAFAAPGGYIGVNAGLITTADDESELAAVLAHEIAHITQKHLLRAFEDAQKTTLPIALAMLGALIATQGASGDAAEAVLATGTSLMQQRQINFTRQDEAEADRVGIQTLARSGFKPEAMADFFGRMDRAIRPGFDESDIPSLLRTHPVSTSRISDAKARALGIQKELGKTSVDAHEIDLTNVLPSLAPPKPAADDLSALPTVRVVAPANRRGSDYFAFMRERVRVLSSDQPGALVGYYADSLRKRPDFETPANRYGYALALLQDRQPDEARTELKPLLEREPDNLALNLARARADLDAGHRGEAVARYAELDRRTPQSRPIVLAYAQALVLDGDKASARKAQDLLRPVMAEEEENPEIYRAFARACELAGDTVRAGEAHADAAILNGRAMDALTQLKELTKRKDLDYYQRARIEARIAELTPIVLELHRRGMRPENQGGRLSARQSCADSGLCVSMSSRRNKSVVE